MSKAGFLNSSGRQVNIYNRVHFRAPLAVIQYDLSSFLHKAPVMFATRVRYEYFCPGFECLLILPQVITAKARRNA